MANDYLKTSEFGKVATSLLGKEKKSQNLDFVYSLVGGYLKGKQRQLKNDLNKAYKDLELEYSSIFSNNEAKYNLAKDERADYQSYLKDPEEFKRLKAIELFNRDPSVLASGKNYSQISNLDETSRAAALELYNRYQKEAEEDIKRLGKSPEVSMATYEMYNKAAMDSYKAKYEALSNDPAKQSLLNAAFAKIFPDMFAKERVQYETAVENAEADKKAQEKLSLSYIKPLEEKEKEDNEADIEVLNNAAQEVGMPVFYTSAERLKLDRDSLIKKMNQSDYKLTLEDLDRAAVLGVKIPGLPNFNDIVVGEREILQSAFVKAKQISAEGANPLDVLEGREKDVYARAIGTTVQAYNKDKMDEEFSRLRLESLKEPNYDRTINQEENEVLNTQLRSDFKILIEEQGKPIDFKLGELRNENGDNLESYFISTAIRTAQALQRLPQYSGPTGRGEAYRKAVQIQMLGLEETSEANILGFGQRFKYNPVDVNWFKVIEKENLNINDAKYLVYGLNKYEYAPRYSPDFEKIVGNQFIEGPYRFYVRNDGMWDYEIIEED